MLLLAPYLFGFIVSSDNSPETLCARAIGQKQFDVALTQCNRAVNEYPSRPNVYYLRCIVKLELNQPKDAYVDCSKAIELDPNDADAYHVRSMVERDLGNFEAAEKDKQKSCELGSSIAC